MTQGTNIEKIDTLTEFLTLGNTHYYIFDLGRLVQRIPNDEFARIEAGQQPYPAPLQQHAWLGIVFWQPQKPQQPFVWFAKFPLDERGLINHAARQHYLQIIVEALGRDITAATDQQQDDKLSQNPYIFTPSDNKRAAFHAQVNVLLGQPPSVFYEDAEAFFSGLRKPDDWQQLGLQGVHDLAARLSSAPAVSNRLADFFSREPAASEDGLQKVLAETLEHHPLPVALQQNLIAKTQQQLAASLTGVNEATLLHLLRSLSSAAPQKSMQSLLRELLQRDCSEDVLLVLGARLWPALTDNTIRKLFLQQLAQHRALFAPLFSDLVAVPLLRPHLLQLLHAPQTQSEAVARAIDEMKAQIKSKAGN